jgi:putative DNA primase/helicase
MSGPQMNEATEAGGFKRNHTERNLNHSSDFTPSGTDAQEASRLVASQIASEFVDAIFCGFNVTKKPDGTVTKQPISKVGLGVGKNTDPANLVAARDIKSAEPLGQYWGVSLHTPAMGPFDDGVLCVLDIDTKRSDAPNDLRIERLMAEAKKRGLLTEQSHSKKGSHIFIFAKVDNTLPPKVDLGNRQEIEIFGQPSSRGISVMLTGTELAGELNWEPIDVRELLTECGIALPVKEAPKPVQAPARPIDTLSKNDDMARAEEALRFIQLTDGGSYDDWRTVGMALQEGFGDAGRQLWVNWSATQPGFKSSDDCDDHWDTFTPGKGITLATLFYMAKQGGYKPKKVDRAALTLQATPNRHQSTNVILTGKDSQPSKTTKEKETLELTDLEQLALRHGSEDSVAMVFASLMAGKLCYVHERGQWMEWNGKYWVADPTNRAFDQLRQITRDFNPTGAKSMGKASFVRGVETFCKHAPEFARSLVQFDLDNYLLNTAGGVIDLRTGSVRPHNPDLMLSKFVPIAPSETGGDNFKRAILEICGGDEELVNFHQLSIGSMLSGAVEEHWFLFWFGRGRNGKNLLADTFFKALGSYAHKMPSEALMTTKNERHPTDLAALAGQRMVLSSEVPDGAHWNEARIKELTGDATLSARFMRQDGFSFNRTHKHLALGNYRPHLQGCGSGIVSRLKLVPFNVSFLGREDRDLPAKLAAEMPYILHWLIEGHMKWMDGGKKLPVCRAVEEASKDYIGAQATIEMWLSECCTVDDDTLSTSAYAKASELYASYRDWKTTRGEGANSMQRWTENMRSAGFESTMSNGARYRKIRLNFSRQL